MTGDRAERRGGGPPVRGEDLEGHFPVRRGVGGGRAVGRAVDGVSVAVSPGETLGLVGESGCGKTTLGRAILRLVEPTGGSIFYKDKDLLAVNAPGLKDLRKEMQIIFQDPYSSLNPRKTIGNAIAEPLKVHKLYTSKVDRKKRVIE